MKLSSSLTGKWQRTESRDCSKQTKKKKVRLSNKVLSSFSGRPEGNSASYIHGLVQSVFYILHKCVLNYRLVMLHWVEREP